jgi:hypothetical protein
MEGGREEGREEGSVRESRRWSRALYPFRLWSGETACMETWGELGDRLLTRGGLARESPTGDSQTEGPVGVKEAGRVLEVHVVAGSTSLTVPALEKEDFLGDSGGDGRGEASLSGGDTGETADVGAAGPEDTAQGVAEHLVREGFVGGDREAAMSVSEPREQGGTVGAALRRVTLLGAEGGDPQVVRGEPVAELVKQVQGGVVGAPDGRVVSFAFAVVFAAGDVNGGGPAEAGNAVSSVKVEPEVAKLEGDEFAHAQATDGGEGHHEAVPIVAGENGPPAEHGDD